MSARTMGRRLRLAVAAAISAVALFAVAAPASQAKVVKLSGSSTVTPTAAVNSFLTAQGVTVTPTGPATAGGPPPSWTFPIALGIGDTKTFNGVLAHSGGLKFTKGSKSYVARRFVAVRFKKHAYLLAQVPGLKGGCPKARSAVALIKRAARKHPKVARSLIRSLRRYCKGGRVIVLGRLRHLAKDVSGSSAKLSADIYLSREAAKVVSKKLGVSVPAGTLIGSAVSNVTVVK
jgi:hypothetical protein